MLDVFVVPAIGFVIAYPRKDHTADKLSANLFRVFSTYGSFQVIRSDSGSDICSQAVKQLLEWYGVSQRIALVGRPQSSGVENTNGRFLRFLLTMITENPSIKTKWGQPHVLQAITYHINNTFNSEYNIKPFAGMFGTLIGNYFQLPRQGIPTDASEYLKTLDADLASINEMAYKHRALLVSDRQSGDPLIQTTFQPGDFVVCKSSKPKPSKLSPSYLGPYVVLQQIKNDVEVKHVVIGTVVKFHVDQLGLFPGTADEAFKMATIDHAQYLVTHISGYRGNPLQRSGMEFLVHFADGDSLYLPFSADLFSTTHFEAYCRSVPELFTLLYTADLAKRRVADLNKTPIPVAPNISAFLNLRFFGMDLYDSFQDLLDSAYESTYFYPVKLGSFLNSKARTKLTAFVPLRNEQITLNGYNFKCYCAETLPAKATLITAALIRQYPLLSNQSSSI
jgi:hypothetical protein